MDEMSFTKQSFHSEELSPKIELKVGKRRRQFPEHSMVSGQPAMQHIIIITSTNYQPGKVVFSEEDKK